MTVASIRTFLQSLSGTTGRKIHVIRGKEAEPLDLFSEFRVMGRRVQFVSFDDMPEGAETHLIDAMERYRTSGCDIVFLVAKKERLAHFGPLLRAWERLEGKPVKNGFVGAVILCLSGEAALDNSFGEAEIELTPPHVAYGAS